MNKKWRIQKVEGVFARDKTSSNAIEQGGKIKGRCSGKSKY